ILYTSQFQRFHCEAGIDECNGLCGEKVLSLQHVLTKDPYGSIQVIHDLCLVPSCQRQHEHRRTLGLAVYRYPAETTYCTIEMLEIDIIRLVDHRLNRSWFKSSMEKRKVNRFIQPVYLT